METYDLSAFVMEGGDCRLMVVAEVPMSVDTPTKTANYLLRAWLTDTTAANPQDCLIGEPDGPATVIDYVDEEIKEWSLDFIRDADYGSRIWCRFSPYRGESVEFVVTI